MEAVLYLFCVWGHKLYAEYVSYRYIILFYAISLAQVESAKVCFGHQLFTSMIPPFPVYTSFSCNPWSCGRFWIIFPHFYPPREPSHPPGSGKKPKPCTIRVPGTFHSLAWTCPWISRTWVSSVLGLCLQKSSTRHLLFQCFRLASLYRLFWVLPSSFYPLRCRSSFPNLASGYTSCWFCLSVSPALAFLQPQQWFNHIWPCPPGLLHPYSGVSWKGLLTTEATAPAWPGKCF